MEETKTSRARVAFVLLCGLAVCCSVMYITADASESVLAEAEKVPNADIGAGFDRLNPASIESVDVKKAGLIMTNTPDGRQRLLTFLNKVEKQIAKEVAGRKADIAAVRAQMAKNFAYNQAARSKMKKALLAKMAINAKKAKDDLDRDMRMVQAKFARFAERENKRNKRTIARSRKTREIMRKNKAHAAKQLKLAVSAQQRALSALASATNAKIHQTNKHIAANAAQIKENAKKARKDLEKAMNRFDHKMANVTEQAKKGRSKLAAQAVAQDKKFRQYANNKIKEITANTASQFRKVRATMARDRAHADMALKHASARMDAALNANKALQDRRFAKTVSDIAAAKKEANARVSKFRRDFKVSILQLSGVVHEQATKLNNRVTQLSGVVQNNKLEQAKVNRNVSAELKRMVKIGDARYKEHLKKDKELRTLMAKNKAETAHRMQKLSNSFFQQISNIRKQMKRDRAHSERRLAAKTAGLYSVLAKNQAAQEAANHALTAATRRAKMDAESALRSAKRSFTSRVAGLNKTVRHLERKHNSAIQHLTGVVVKNDIKDAAGRARLRAISKFNKAQLKSAVRDAIHKGEQRALKIEKKMKSINKKTRAALNNRVSTEISALAKNIHSQIDELNLQTKSARAEMRKEVLYAIKSAAAIAKANLKKKVAWAEAQFASLHKGLSAEEKKGGAARAALSASIARNKKHVIDQIGDAVATQQRALLGLKEETAKKIKKTNRNISAHAEQMAKNARIVAAQMKSDTAAINAKLEAARKAAVVELAAVNAASAARYTAVVKTVEKGVESARKWANKRFGHVYERMAKDRKTLDRNMGAAVANLNDQLAKQSALADSRFSTTVKNIRAARIAAAKDVQNARKYFTTEIVALTSKIKQQETRLRGDIQVVSAMVISDKANQIRINGKVKAERNKIVKIANARHSSNVRARGMLRKLMDQNKAAAQEEVSALAKHSYAALAKTRHRQAGYVRSFAKDLTKATKKLHITLNKASANQEQVLAGMKKKLAYTQAASAGQLRATKAMFKSRVNTLVNAITANAASAQRGIRHLTKVARNWKHADAADRKLIRVQRSAMKNDLDKALARAIQLGEARAKAVEERANENIAVTKKGLASQIAVQVENMADNVFSLVQGNRQKIADNYLSLKAYAATAADKITDYLSKGKGRNLMSVGDLLQTVASLSTVKAHPAAGEGFGSPKIPLIFSGKNVKINGAVSKINGLVNEYIKTIGQVRARWPMGLGKYLVAKLETAMQSTGALEVDKVADKAGNYVFVNGHAVGLSSKLSDFASLAVHMTAYERTLARLTGKLSTKKKAGKVSVTPPEWQGN
jgi:hypothetical protein